MTYSSIDNKEQKRRTCPPAWRKVAAGVLFAFALGLGFGAVSGVAGRASPWTALAEISTVRTTPMSTVALCLGRFSKESAGCLEDKKKPCFMSGTCEDLDEDLCHERISGGAARWYAALWNSDGEDPHHAGYCEDRSVNFLPCRWDRFAAVPKCSAQGLSQSGCRNDDDIGQVWDLYTAGHPPGTKRYSCEENRYTCSCNGGTSGIGKHGGPTKCFYEGGQDCAECVNGPNCLHLELEQPPSAAVDIGDPHTDPEHADPEKWNSYCSC
mmetsp:Transcript_12886/g.39777  ORF Transcript_12886/g.39777 Transcript_12886/m.39777 type:complete len:268 (-) Transcript_12886:174-977(-)